MYAFLDFIISLTRFYWLFALFLVASQNYGNYLRLNVAKTGYYVSIVIFCPLARRCREHDRIGIIPWANREIARNVWLPNIPSRPIGVVTAINTLPHIWDTDLRYLRQCSLSRKAQLGFKSSAWHVIDTICSWLRIAPSVPCNWKTCHISDHNSRNIV